MGRLMIRDLDIGLLRAFVAVVETGGVTSAARLLNRTQAAVSLQIKRLEELIGTELFQRERKRLILAPAGERLLGAAQKLITLNDEIWGRMTTPHFEGEVRLGVPYDIVTAYIPPILRRFAASWPRVRVTLVCKDSKLLISELQDGDIDLTFTTELDVNAHGETMHYDQLIWAGVPGGDAHLRNPLPVSLGAPTCMFRPQAIEALRRAGRDWRVVCEVSNMEPVCATISAGLAVAPMLASSVPPGLEILGPESGLPALPEYRINLYEPRTGPTDIAAELTRHIRQEFKVRFGGVKGIAARRALPVVVGRPGERAA